MMTRRQMLMMLAEKNNKWLEIRNNVRAGRAAQEYDIGDELLSSYSYNGTTYDCPWIVLDNDRECEWEDGTKHPGLWLTMKHCTAEALQFDADEGVEATEETAQEGVYYCGFDKNSTPEMINLSTGDPIPYSSYVRIKKGILSDSMAYGGYCGYNRWRDSAARQWLNSAGAIGEWWQSTHLGDNPPSQLSTMSGFMAHIPSDFLSVVTPVKIKTVCNTVTDGGAIDTTVDRFFLQSREEMYGTPPTSYEGVEGLYFPYWKIKTGLSSPTDLTVKSDGRKVTSIDDPTGNAKIFAMRSALTSQVERVLYMTSKGAIDYMGSAASVRCLLPACVIS